MLLFGNPVANFWLSWMKLPDHRQVFWLPVSGIRSPSMFYPKNHLPAIEAVGYHTPTLMRDRNWRGYWGEFFIQQILHIIEFVRRVAAIQLISPHLPLLT